MEMPHIVIVLIAAFLLFEVIEHVVVPLVFYLLKRRKLSATDVESLQGEVVRIRQWKGKEGQVFMKGELWRAESEVPFKQGDRAVVDNVKGLTLTVKPIANRDKR
jgi:membrane-bound serine protease (ClpP class)